MLKRKREREKTEKKRVTSILQVTLNYKMELLEAKGCQGKHFTYLLLLPTSNLYPSSPELFIIMPSHVYNSGCYFGCLNCFSTEEHYTLKKHSPNLPLYYKLIEEIGSCFNYISCSKTRHILSDTAHLTQTDFSIMMEVTDVATENLLLRVTCLSCEM